MRVTILPQSRTIADNPFVSTKTFLFHSRHSFHRPVTGRQHSLHYLFNEKGNFIHDPSLSQYERCNHITDRKRKHFPDTKCFPLSGQISSEIVNCSILLRRTRTNRRNSSIGSKIDHDGRKWFPSKTEWHTV